MIFCFVDGQRLKSRHLLRNNKESWLQRWNKAAEGIPDMILNINSVSSGFYLLRKF